MIDLHIHSHYSDGQDSRERLLEIVVERGVGLCSITDHNYIHPSMVSPVVGIRVIEGVEISSVDRVTGQSLHILGYSKKFNTLKLNAALAPVLDGYNRRAQHIIVSLNQRFGCALDFEKLKSNSPAMFVSRNMIASVLRRQPGVSLSPQEAVREAYVRGENDSFMPDIREAIELIRQCDGVAVLAHPGNLAEKIDLSDLVARLAQVGLIGLEAYYPTHDESVVVSLCNLAAQNGLITTAGSDWHGPDFSRHPIGMKTPEDIGDDLLRRL